MPLSLLQSRLSESLFDHNFSLGKMYLGGLHAFTDSANPDRIAQSAHSFRELMEKAPEYINVPQEARKRRTGFSLRSAINTIKDFWTKAQGNSDCYNSNLGWSGEIDRPLANFLMRLSEFFKKYEENRPTRNQDFIELLKRMDPSTEVLPKTVEIVIVREWGSLKDAFLKICHHRYSPTLPEFQRYIEQLEQMLIAVIVPQTVSDHEAIKQEIAILEGQ